MCAGWFYLNGHFVWPEDTLLTMQKVLSEGNVACLQFGLQLVKMPEDYRQNACNMASGTFMA